ncbi:MAG: PDZ domain-containing protein [Balneolales bacterium]|nr:PDZ domain-containing protein [Balneolales bacterium]
MISKITRGLVAFLIIISTGQAQELEESYFQLETRKNRSVRMDFEWYNNLVVIPVIVNNSSDTLKFVLDTGVSQTLITGLPNGEEVTLNYVDEIRVAGLGEGESIEAYYSVGNKIAIDQTTGFNQEIVVLKEDIFNFSTLLGTYVHGLIGHSIFNEFIVEIDYNQRWIKFHDPENFANKYNQKRRSRDWTEIPISIQNNKPYVNVELTQFDGSTVELSLLIDSGASHAMSLYYSANDELLLPELRLRSFLGNGLSGEINGYIASANELTLGKYTFKNPISSYPDEEGIRRALVYSSRDGSIGSEILKRFKVFFNYQDSTMLVRPSRYFDDEFSYNKIGIEIATPFPTIKLYEVSYVRPGSVADEGGINAGDFITEIDGKSSSSYTLNEALDLFYRNQSNRLRLKLVRRDSTFRKELRFENELISN